MKRENNFDLTNYNSYRLKAKCRTAFFPETEEEIIALYRKRKDYILLGGGYNVILSQQYYDRDFIIFNGNFQNYNINLLGLLEAESGCSMISLSNIALESSLSGLEIFCDIPGSLGGAVVMNAGASGEEIKDILVKIRYLDLENMTIDELSRADLQFGYRNSLFQRKSNMIVLKAWLQLKGADKSAINEKMESVKAARWAKQPKEWPNAGSVFKRPVGHFVGPMIEELGLKGFSIGGAKISEKHGGFIINYNNASGSDILKIISVVKEKVFTRYGVDLEVEQRIV